MKLGKKQEPMSAEELLSKVDAWTVYRYYIGSFNVGQLMQNPCIAKRQNTPSFGIYVKGGKLYHNDFANPDIHGDCIDMVRQLYNISLSQAIEKIAQDMGILSGTSQYKKLQRERPILDEKRYTLIQVRADIWTKERLQYWEDYGITLEQLKREQVYPVAEWSLNRKRQVIEPGELCYAYRYKEGFKIYYPHRTGSDKWKSNIPTKLVEGVERLNGHNKVVITKAKKERLMLEQILPADIGIINTQNESIAAYTPELVDILQGRQVWISYDCDPPGKAASLKVNHKYPQWRHVNVPDWFYEQRGLKDWGELMICGEQRAIIEEFKKKGII